MRRFGIIIAATVFFSLLAASQSHADSTNWTGTTGDWHDPLNWDNGIPISSDYAYIDNGGTAQISADAELYYLYAGYNNSGTVEQTGGLHTVGSYLHLGYSSGSNGTYNLSGTAQLSVDSSEYIGYYGTGEFNQSGGTHSVDGRLYLGYLSGSSGTYNLSGTAQLSVDSSEYIGYYGTGEFNQSGGTHSVGGQLHLGYLSGSSGTYNLSGGELTAGYESIGYVYGTGEFSQSGGTNTVGYLYVKDDSSYTLSGGTLSIGDNAEINGSFHFTDGDWALNINGGLANFENAVIDGAGSASFNSAANTLTIFPTGFDPAVQFGSYNALGLVHTAGSTLVISAGEGFAGHGWIGDHVQNRGNIVASGMALDFRGGLTISEGGTLDSSSYNLTVDNGATVTIAASGGAVSALSEYIGTYGTGEFNQDGGTNTVSNFLYLGHESGSSGTYNQSGGTNTVGYLFVNDGSSYNFSGGTLSVSDSTEVNGSFHFDNGNGVLNINGGLANFTDAVIDGAGSASFNSAANTLTIFPTGFDPVTEFGSYNALGLVHTAGSTLVISAGEGFAGRGWIGDHVLNRGNIVASGRSLDFRGGLTISDGGTLDSGTEAFCVDDTTITIAASGGELTVGSREYIGNYGTGEFNQDGGIHTVNYDLYIGYESGASGTYNLSAGELSVGSSEYIGGSYWGSLTGTGEFNQTGGTHTVSSILHIGYLSGSSGTYNLSAGELSVGFNEYIGRYGTGEFNQTGGTHTLTYSLWLGYNTGSSGIYNFLDGELFVHGDIRVNYGYFTDTGALNSGEIYLGGHFINQSEESELFSMVHTTLTIWGGEEEQPSVLDMNSIDYGAHCAGLVDNFALGTLVFEGNPVGTSTCYRLDSDVYTYGLALNEGAHLDLNGHTLYYVPLNHSYYGISPSTFCLCGTWVNGDIVAIIPEPATIALISAGLLGLAGLARGKCRSIGV